MSNCDRLFGLLDHYSKQQIPLKEIKVHAFIKHIIAEVSCDYLFENAFDDFLEADFVFPLNSTSSVYRFEATIGNELFVSHCRERVEAESTYRNAVTNDHTAFILNEDEEMGDIFTFRLGNIPPRGSVHLSISYFDQLDTRRVDFIDPQRLDSPIRSLTVFSLPALINQRYQPKNNQLERQFGPASTFPIVKGSLPYIFSFTADVFSSSPLLSISCTQHKFVLDQQSKMFTKVRLATDFDFTRDLEMELAFTDPHSLALAYEPGTGSPSASSFGILDMDCLVANFLPILPDMPCDRSEIIFIIDRSGSMDGANILQAKRALLILLKSLPTNCRFQVIGFGSSHQALFPEPLDYTEANLNTALAYQRNMEADMGGTDVLSVVRSIYNTPPTDEGWSRQIIFLTDGDVFNQTEIISLVKQESSKSKGRLFAIGLGEGASTSLVSGMARGGRGKSIFVRSAEGNSLQEAVMDLLQLALQRPAEEMRLEWSVQVGPTPTTVFTVPKHLAPIFTGNYFTAIGMVKNPKNEPVEGKVILRFKVGGKPFSYESAISSSSPSLSSPSLGFHRMAAKLQIMELTDEYSTLICGKPFDKDNQLQLRKLQNEIVSFSIATNVLSRFTAFVGFNPARQEHLERRCISIPRRVTNMAFDGVDSVDCCPFSTDRMLLQGGPAKVATNKCSVQQERMKAEEKEEEDVLIVLAELQLFSGAWVHSADLTRITGTPMGKLNSVASFCDPDVEKMVWSTCHVIAFLQTKLSPRCTEWQLIKMKATDWLLRTLNSSQDLVEQCITAAIAIFHST